MLNIRKIGALGRTYRHLNRYRQILLILVRHGFEDVVENLGIDQYFENGLNALNIGKGLPRTEKPGRPQRIRQAIEELGPTFIKLGQILSTRPDLVPVDIMEELSSLQDNVAPFPSDEAVKLLEYSLGKKISDVFGFFDETPIASASIGQVHKASLKSGDDVAIKIQRPGIQKIIETDLEILMHMATLMESHIEGAEFHRPVRIVEEFAKYIEREMDYSNEASNMERVARMFRSDPKVYIPYVFREFSTSSVLVMEYVDAVKITDLEKLDGQGLDRKKIVNRGSDLVLKQIFYHGFFHADPHPGNLAVLPGNVICLYDFGMMGVVGRSMREMFLELVEAVVNENPKKTCEVLVAITEWDAEPDMRMLETEAADFISRHFYKTLKDIHIGILMKELVEILAKHQLRLPPDLFLMIKALATVEGVALMLDPDFDMIARAAPFIAKAKAARLSPKRIASDILGLSGDFYRFMQFFPAELLASMKRLRQDKITLKLELNDMEKMLAAHHTISNRISFSIVIAALIIGSAMIVMAKTPPLFWGVSLFGIIGFGVAAAFGIWLLIAIISKGSL